jgi:hypothetical protein
MILDAEMKAIHGSSRKDLKPAHDKAIAAATRAGFLQDGALASHLVFAPWVVRMHHSIGTVLLIYRENGVQTES